MKCRAVEETQISFVKLWEDNFWREELLHSSSWRDINYDKMWRSQSIVQQSITG